MTTRQHNSVTQKDVDNHPSGINPVGVEVTDQTLDPSGADLPNSGDYLIYTKLGVPTVIDHLGTATPIGGTPSFATPTIALASSAAAGAAGSVIRSDSTIAAFDATSPSTQAIGDSAVVGTAAFAARRDHKHAITNPLTTQDDLWVAGSSGAPGRLAKGSDGQVLTVNASTHHLDWENPSSGFANPMTTKGDIITGDTGGTATRLAAGTSTYVLTSNGAAAFPSWQAAPGGSLEVKEIDGSPDVTGVSVIQVSNGTLTDNGGGNVTITTGGGGGSSNYEWALDVPPGSPSVYDDEFPGSTLDTTSGHPWTNPITSNSGNALTLSVGNGWVTWTPAAGSKRCYGIRKNSPTGVDFTVAAKISDGSYAGTHLDDGRIGIFVANSSGKAYILGFDYSSSNEFFNMGVTTYSESADWSSYDGTYNHIGVIPSWGFVNTRFWYRIRYDSAGTTLHFDGSVDGVAWYLDIVSSIGSVSSLDRMGIVNYANNADMVTTHRMSAKWFRVTT